MTDRQWIESDDKSSKCLWPSEVKTIDKKLVISASRMERIGSRTSTKELNREFHLPDTVDPMAVKAFFSDTGKMIIEAPYMRPIAVGHFSGHEGSPLSGR